MRDAPRPAAGNGRPREARSADDGKNAPHIAALPSSVQTAVDRGGRECGSCSLCCCVLEIVELNKPAHKWCRHFRPSGKGGCSIYADRPQVCRGFACQWLLDASWPEHWFPQRARMVVHGTAEHGEKTVTIHVDRRCPARWREEPYFSDIRRLALHGLKQDDGDLFATRVVVGARSWLILPHREIELSAGDCGVFISVGPDEFEWIKTRSRADAEQLIAITEALAAGMPREAVPADRQAHALIKKYSVRGEPDY